MSLQSVAERAGVSKGGLLYHFPSKRALLRALVAAHVDERDADMESASERFSGSCNPLLRAVIESHAAKIRKAQPPGGILAAIAADPQMVDPVREQTRRIFQRLRKQAARPEEAFVVNLVLEGLRVHDLFEIDALTKQERERVLAFLVAFVEGEGWPDPAETGSETD